MIPHLVACGAAVSLAVWVAVSDKFLPPFRHHIRHHRKGRR